MLTRVNTLLLFGAVTFAAPVKKQGAGVASYSTYDLPASYTTYDLPASYVAYMRITSAQTNTI